MHSRRTPSDPKSTASLSSTLSTMPPPPSSSSSLTTTTNPSTSSGRVSIYSMRERVILNKMTRMMGKLAPDTETEVASRLHQEIPAIRVDGHLIYCLYITLQNFIHVNVIYLILYHTVFWFDPSKSYNEIIKSSNIIAQNQYEQTHLLTYTTNYYTKARQSINIDLINKYIYISLLLINFIKLLSAFLWTIKKKLPYLIQRHQKLKYRLNKVLTLLIFLIYLLFISWIFYQTFITKNLSINVCSCICIHLIFLTILEKPNLFKPSPYNSSKQSGNSRQKHYRNSTSSSSTSSIVTNVLNRLSYRSSTSTPARKINPSGNLLITQTTTTLIPWSRWTSVLEEKLEVHQCSTFYSYARQEADDLWPTVVRRIILNFYHTFSSLVLYDLIPLKTMDSHTRSAESQPIKFLIVIFTLSTFITHSAFLFPVKLQTTLHRIATHLGQWRQQSNLRTDTINEWSSECNSYTRGSVIKFSSNNQSYIAIQHLNNAANPQSKSHSILYRLFGDPTYFLTIQFLFCLFLIILHLIWIVRGKHWEQIIIGCLIIFYSSYPIFKIVRNRIIIDFVEEHEIYQISTTSKQKKSS